MVLGPTFIGICIFFFYKYNRTFNNFKSSQKLHYQNNMTPKIMKNMLKSDFRKKKFESLHMEKRFTTVFANEKLLQIYTSGNDFLESP